MTTAEHRPRIGILGSGRMAEVLVPLWVGAGYPVLVGGRDPGKAAALAAQSGAEGGSLAAAAEFAQVGVMAVLYQGIDSTLDAIGAALTGKVLIDTTNPVEIENFTLTTPPGTSIAGHVADRTGADVVKALNQVEAVVYRDRVRFGGRSLRVPMAGSPRAQAIAAPVIAALDVEPFDAGSIEHALHLEAAAAVVIRLLFGGASPYTVFQLTEGEPG